MQLFGLPGGLTASSGVKAPFQHVSHFYSQSGRHPRRICRLWWIIRRLQPAIVMAKMPRSSTAALATSLAPSFAFHTAKLSVTPSEFSLSSPLALGVRTYCHEGLELSLNSSVMNPVTDEIGRTLLTGGVDERLGPCEGNSLQSDSSLSEPSSGLNVNALNTELAISKADEAHSPPPVNSDYLPLPWKGRLGYVGIS
jgi:hypothetical protein